MLHCYLSIAGFLFTEVLARSYVLNEFERTQDTLETFLYLVWFNI